MSALGVTPSAATGQSSLAQRAASTIRHPLSRTLLVLTFTTGLVDAASYLGIGHVFTANMTGNIVFLGFGIAGSGGLPVVAPLISLVAFMAGAGGGGVLASRLAPRHAQHMARALSIELLCCRSLRSSRRRSRSAQTPSRAMP